MGDITDCTINNNTYGLYIDESGYSGLSGYSGFSGWSGWSGQSGGSGISGYSGLSGWSGWSGQSGGGGALTVSAYTGWIALYQGCMPETSQFVSVEDIIFDEDGADYAPLMAVVKESATATTPGNRGHWKYQPSDIVPNWNPALWTRLGTIPNAIPVANCHKTVNGQFMCAPYESGGSYALGVYSEGALVWAVWPDSGGVGQRIKNCGISPYGTYVWACGTEDASGFSAVIWAYSGVV